MNFIKIAIIFLLASSISFSQKVTVEVNNQSIKLGEVFGVNFSSENGLVENVEMPKIANTQIVSGPNRSQSTSIINGSASSKSSIGYMLVANKIGTITIPPAKVTIKGRIITTESKNIVISSPQAIAKVKTNNEVFLEGNINKSKGYLGEQFILEYTLYTKVNVTDASVMSESKYDGFFSKEITPSEVLNSNVNIKGKNYIKRIMSRIALFPTRTGQYTLEPLTLKLIVNNDTGFDPFDFGMDFKNLVVQSNPININVIDMPKTKGIESNTLACSLFELESSMDKSRLTTDDVAKLSLKVITDGDPKRLIPPTMDSTSDFQISLPKLMKDTSYSANGKYITEKWVEYLLYPQKVGKLRFSSSWSYFSTKSNRNINLPIGLYSFDITKGTIAKNPILENESIVSNSIGKVIYIFTLKKNSPLLLNTKVFWLWFLFPLLVYLGTYFYKNYLDRLRNIDINILRKRKALSKANRKLKTAQIYLQMKDNRSYYNEIIKTLMSYVSDKLHIEQAQLNKENIVTKLEEFNVAESSIKQLVSLLSTSEVALFAGQSSDATVMKKNFDEAKLIIHKLENELKIQS
jgi:BatD DUF11 like domain